MNVSISRNGTELGDWPEDQVRILVKNGTLLATDYYWKEGMTEWAELSKMIKPPPPAGKTQPIVISPSVASSQVAVSSSKIKRQPEALTKAFVKPVPSFEEEYIGPFVITARCYFYCVIGIALCFFGSFLSLVLPLKGTLALSVAGIGSFAGLLGIICGASFILRLYGWLRGLGVLGLMGLLMLLPLIYLLNLILIVRAERKFKKLLNENGYKLGQFGNLVSDQSKSVSPQS